MNSCPLHQDLRAQVSDHEVRIDNLEKHDSMMDERVEHLCNKLDKLAGWIEKLVFAIGGTLIVGGGSFVIWYIQSLPRG